MTSEILKRDNAIEILKTEVESLKKVVTFWREKAETKIYEVGHKEQRIIRLEAEVAELKESNSKLAVAAVLPFEPTDKELKEEQTETKLCARCGKHKDVDEFYINSSKGSRQSYCKDCCSEMSKYAAKIKALEKAKAKLEKEIKQFEKYPDSQQAAIKVVNLEEVLDEINRMTVEELSKKREATLRNIHELEIRTDLKSFEKAILGGYKKNLEKIKKELKELGVKH